MNESQLIDRIRQRHPSPAWAVLSHVRNQTGFRRRVRTADAMALSLWPSNGDSLHGFEVKCSVQDLRKELLDPSKAAEFSEFCDYWWLVIAKPELIQGLQIPEKWGVLAPHGKSLKVVKAAPKLEAKPLSKTLLCGMVRKASEAIEDQLKRMVPREDFDAKVEEALAKRIKADSLPIEYELKKLKESVAEFEKASGIAIAHQWRVGRIGEAVKYFMERRNSGVHSMIEAELGQTRTYLASLEKVASEILPKEQTAT